MKRIRIVQFVGIALFIAYLLVFVTDLVRGVLGGYKETVFSLFMALVGVNLLVKGVLIKSNSTLWFANVLITMSLTIVVVSLVGLEITKVYYMFTIIPIFASVINLIVFKNLIYVKIIIINITIIVPAVIQFLKNLDIYWTVGLFVISVLIGILVCRLINFDKENV